MDLRGLTKNMLGRTGLEVSRLGYGSWEIEGRVKGNPLSRPISQRHVSLLLNEALDNGINFIDTADCYGRAEESIGEALAHRRQEVFIATKCGCHPRGMSRSNVLTPKPFTKESVLKNLERSLRRLDTDYVDLLQLHGPDVDVSEIHGLIESMQELRQQGKVRWIGVSTDMPWLPPLSGIDEFDVFQVGYHIFRRDTEKWMFRLSDSGAGIIVRTGAAKGMNFGIGTEAETHGFRPLPGDWKSFEESGLDELREDGESRVSFILRYVISLCQIHTVIVGTQSVVHLRENIDAVTRGPLSMDVLDEANKRIGKSGFESKST